MKITRDKMFFSKDLIHTMAYVGMFVAAIISVGACKSGIWVAAILAWIVAGIIIGLAIISDYKKASSSNPTVGNQRLREINVP